jgi:hypothetical protein
MVSKTSCVMLESTSIIWIKLKVQSKGT